MFYKKYVCGLNGVYVDCWLTHLAAIPFSPPLPPHSALLVLPQFFFGIYSAFSGQNFYNDVYYQLCK